MSLKKVTLNRVAPQEQFVLNLQTQHILFH